MAEHKYKYSLKTISISLIVGTVAVWTILFSIYFYLTKNVDEFRLENENYSWLLLLIPILLAGFVINLIWKNKAIKKLSDKRLSPFLISPISSVKTFLKLFTLILAISFLIIALINPQYGKGKQKAVSDGIEIMIALDISNSMYALDLDPQRDRLKVAKMGIERLIDKLHGDKIGIVIFAGDAYVQLPLTTDYNVAKMFLSTISPDMISNQGTSISKAINTSMESFDMQNGVNKAIIIMSDGEDFEGEAILAAKQAIDSNVVVNTVGMGTTKGTVIPDYKNGTRVGLKTDGNGNIVMTKLNEEILQEIAKAGGGSYTLAQGTHVNLEGL
jgi:Ca-activated chloride channel family protein